MERTVHERLQIQTECRAVLHIANNCLHDRDCVIVQKLFDKPESEVKLLSHVTPEQYNRAQTCRYCIRKLAIRNGIRSSPRYIKALLYFFQKVGASTYYLRKLFITHAGHLRYINSDTIEIQVREDVWRVVRADGSLQLYHRNYVADKDNFRLFQDGFHRQRICDGWDTDDFGSIARIIWTYDYHRMHTKKLARTKAKET